MGKRGPKARLQTIGKTRRRSREGSRAIDIGTISLSRTGPLSLQEQLTAALRNAILDGLLAPGSPLPSSRLFADELGVSRTTTLRALESLVLEGLAEATIGSGTRVASVIPGMDKARSTAAITVSPPRSNRLSANIESRLAAFSEVRFAAAPKPFAPGVPALDQFPIDAWTKIFSNRLRRARISDLCRSDGPGTAELRTAIATHLGASRAARCTPDSVLVVTGTQQAISLATRVLTEPGDICWIEEPGYLSARNALLMANLNLVLAPVDTEGMMVEEAIATLPIPKLIYVTPSHQHPLGGTMNEARRRALIEYAEDVGAWIIEDDYDNDFAAAGSPVICLQGLDRFDRVIYLGTFNKTMFPSLRLGFAIVPSDLVQAFCTARDYTDGPPSTLMQAALGDFMTSGAYSSHVRRLRKVYERRRAAMVTAVKEHLPELNIGVHDRGLHFVVYLPNDVNDVAGAIQLAKEDIVVRPLSVFYLGEVSQKGFLLGSACVPEAQIPGAVRQLAAIFHSCRPLTAKP